MEVIDKGSVETNIASIPGGVVAGALAQAPALIERLLPVQKLSAEAYKEQMAVQGKTLTALGYRKRSKHWCSGCGPKLTDWMWKQMGKAGGLRCFCIVWKRVAHKLAGWYRYCRSSLLARGIKLWRN